jgi:hypothetical protein
MSPLSRFTLATCACLILITNTACYTTWSAADGSPLPTSGTIEPIAESVGVIVIEPLPQGTELTATAIAERIAGRLRDDQVFSIVVFPFSDLSAVKPDLLLALRIRSEQDLKMRWNLPKAILVGLSMSLLQPVLPTVFSATVNVEAEVSDLSRRVVAEYSSTTQYEFKSTWFMPSSDSLGRYLQDTADHAAQYVVNQLKDDRANLAAAVR